MRIDGLDEQEGKVMDALVLAIGEFRKLKMQHPNENLDFINGIHQCQYVLAIRNVRRDYPDGWPKYEK